MRESEEDYFLARDSGNVVNRKELSRESDDFFAFDGLLNSENQISLSPNGRDIVFYFFLISNILISMDHGSIPASVNELRLLTTYDQSIGLFGSLVYFGNIIGSMVFFSIMDKYSRKTLLIISLLGNSICLFTFVIFSNIIFLFLNRVLVGTLQAYITIYMPIWCNQYGLKTRRNYMIALIQLVSPIGIFLGYFIASVGISSQIYGGWKFAFVVQAILIFILTICFIFCPKNFFAKDWMSFGENKEEEKIIHVKITTSREEKNSLDYFGKLKVLMKYKVYIFSVISLSILIYIITGVQYWVSDYLDAVLGVQSPKDRLFLFTLACFTAPVMGVLLGPLIQDKLCQTNMQKSLIFCSVLGFLASVCSIPAPCTLNLFYFIILMWFILFFGGGIVPILTSIIINSVPKNLITSANSLTNFTTNALGYLPSPYIYGILSDIYGDLGRMGMKVTLWLAVVGEMFSLLAVYYSFQDEEFYKLKVI